MSEQSSNTSQTASAFYDPDSSSWRTSQGSLLSEEYPLLERLPDWGTTADGALFEQAIPERLIAVRDGSASPNLPTPRVSMKNNPSERELAEGNPKARLETAAALLPTPTARDYKDQGENVDLTRSATKGHLSGLPLLLPTPTTVDSKVFGPNVDWQLRLSNHALHTASVLMNLPSNDGNGLSDDQHQTQPTSEDYDQNSSSG